MPLREKDILVFRVTLAVALLVISYLAFTPVHYQLVDSIWDKANHACSFLVLSLLGDFSFPVSKFGLRKILPLVAYGMLIEAVQHFLPYRDFELGDVLADVAGVAIYMLVLPGVRRLPVLRSR